VKFFAVKYSFHFSLWITSLFIPMLELTLNYI